MALCGLSTALWTKTDSKMENSLEISYRAFPTNLWHKSGMVAGQQGTGNCYVPDNWGSHNVGNLETQVDLKVQSVASYIFNYFTHPKSSCKSTVFV